MGETDEGLFGEVLSRMTGAAFQREEKKEA